MTDVKHHFFKVQMKLIYLYYQKLNGMLLKGLIKKETTIDKKELYLLKMLFTCTIRTTNQNKFHDKVKIINLRTKIFNDLSNLEFSYDYLS